MASNREQKLLKAWVRYDGNGDTIPNSMIYRKRKPAGKFKEVTTPATDLCCPNPTPSPTPTLLCGGSYWIDELNNDEYRLPVATRVDSACNVYAMHYIEYDFPTINGETSVNPIVVIKYDKNGNILWENYYGNVNSEIYSYRPAGMAIDSDDYLYVSFARYILKIAPDGSVVWQTPLSETSVDDSEVGEDWGNIAVYKNNYVYTIGWQYNTLKGYPILVGQFDAQTGSHITTKKILMPILAGTSSYYYTMYSLITDNVGNIIVALGAYDSNIFGDQAPGGLLKLDAGLNVVWASNFYFPVSNGIDPISNGVYRGNNPSPWPDLEPLDLRVDKYNNIYITTASSVDIAKFNSEGQLLFDYIFYSIYGDPINWDANYLPQIATIATDPDTNQFWALGTIRRMAIEESPLSPYNGLVLIMNFDNSGNLNFATTLSNTDASLQYAVRNGQYMYDGSYAKGGNFHLYFWGGNTSPVTIANIKIPNTSVSGTFGDFVLTDVTDKFNRYEYHPIVSYQNTSSENIGIGTNSGIIDTEATTITDTITIITP